MADSVLHHDIETRSPVDLRATGQYVYAESPDTQVILMSWAIDEGPITTWQVIAGEPMPRELREAFLDPAVAIGAHNASFERVQETTCPLRPQKFLDAEVLRAVRDLNRWDCTAARSARMGLPRSLDGASVALRLREKKDDEGSTLMRRMCAPRELDSHGVWQWHETPAEIERLARYCEQDVRVERELHRQLPPLSAFEKQVWMTTERMNDRGVPVDSALVTRLAFFVVGAEQDVNERLKRATCQATDKCLDVAACKRDCGCVPKVSNHAKIKAWLIANGYPEIKSVGKAVVEEMLQSEETSDLVREAIIMRKEGGKSSTAKFKAIMNRMNRDGRLRGSLMYCGAPSTGRFSSVGAQLQNLTRGGTIKTIDAAIEDILNGAEYQQIQEKHGAPMVVASECCRPVFTSGDEAGMWLARGDYAQIELRVNAWCAGEEKVLQAFRDYDTIVCYDAKGKPLRAGPDLYILAAADIAGVHPSEIDKDDPRRQWGKVSELACIAEGEMVLTDQGKVPIELVTRRMRVFDGEQFVDHKGIVYKGVRECVTYDGLTATPDHLVFPDDWTGAARPLEHLMRIGERIHAPAQRIRFGSPKAAETAGERPVYDILHAGPRNRFVCQGRLVHNCGFGGGAGAFQAFARIYRVKVPDEKAAEIVGTWREKRPNIVKYWYRLRDQAMACMRSEPGPRFEVRPGLWFVRGPRALVMRLPSGTALFYWYPEIIQQETPWGLKDAITYSSQFEGRWSRGQIAWHGILCENPTQALARDKMAAAKVRIDAAGGSPVLSVHDEVICKLSRSLYPTVQSAKDFVIGQMTIADPWEAKLPVAVDASASYRYVKD